MSCWKQTNRNWDLNDQSDKWHQSIWGLKNILSYKSFNYLDVERGSTTWIHPAESIKPMHVCHLCVGFSASFCIQEVVHLCIVYTVHFRSCRPNKLPRSWQMVWVSRWRDTTQKEVHWQPTERCMMMGPRFPQRRTDRGALQKGHWLVDMFGPLPWTCSRPGAHASGPWREAFSLRTREGVFMNCADNVLDSAIEDK